MVLTVWMKVKIIYLCFLEPCFVVSFLKIVYYNQLFYAHIRVIIYS